MPRRPSPADREIARLHTADEAANVAYTTALGHAYDLALPEADEETAFAALRAAGVRCRETNLALLAAIDARREGSVHPLIVADSSPIRTNQEASV